MVTKVKQSHKMTKQERIAALREKLAKTDTGGGGKGFWSPKVGRNVVRVLPEVGDMDFFFQEVGKHVFPDGRSVYCPKFTSVGEKECPICELIDDLYADGSQSSKKLAKAIRLRRAYWMNIVNRDDETQDNPVGSGPLIFTPGVKIFDQINNMITDPEVGDITDVNDGIDIIIKRTGTGLDTDYDVLPKRNSSPLSADADVVTQWLDEAKDLSWVEVSEDEKEDKELAGDHAVYVLPYERIEKEFGLDDLDVEELASAVKEDTKPADKEEVEEPRAKKSKVPVKEIDEDTSEVEEEVNTRIARRSRRH